MEKNGRKYIFIGVIAIIVLGALIGGIYALNHKGTDEPKAEEKEQNNTTETPMISDEIDSFVFIIEEATFEDGTSDFMVKITNQSGEPAYINTFAMRIKDSEGNEMIKLTGIVNEEIEANGTRTVGCSYGGDLSGYASVDFAIEK